MVNVVVIAVFTIIMRVGHVNQFLIVYGTFGQL